MKHYDELIDIIKDIDLDSVPADGVYRERDAITKVIEEQKVYFWIRLYLNEENDDIKVGDDIIIKYATSGETLDTKFITYSKKGMDKDLNDITQYEKEFDKRVLCMMVDMSMVNNNDSIPFIRTLFKIGIHYEYQLFKREDLQFINKRTNEVLEYYDCDF
jgi:hypothetical protein